MALPSTATAAPRAAHLTPPGDHRSLPPAPPPQTCKALRRHGNQPSSGGDLWPHRQRADTPAPRTEQAPAQARDPPNPATTGSEAKAEAHVDAAADNLAAQQPPTNLHGIDYLKPNLEN